MIRCQELESKALQCPSAFGFFKFAQILSLSLSLCLSVQLISEKISGAEGTKLDEDFQEMERVRGWGFQGFWNEGRPGVPS